MTPTHGLNHDSIMLFCNKLEAVGKMSLKFKKKKLDLVM